MILDHIFCPKKNLITDDDFGTKFFVTKKILITGNALERTEQTGDAFGPIFPNKKFNYRRWFWNKIFLYLTKFFITGDDLSQAMILEQNFLTFTGRSITGDRLWQTIDD